MESFKVIHLDQFQFKDGFFKFEDIRIGKVQNLWEFSLKVFRV